MHHDHEIEELAKQLKMLRSPLPVVAVLLWTAFGLLILKRLMP